MVHSRKSARFFALFGLVGLILFSAASSAFAEQKTGAAAAAKAKLVLQESKGFVRSNVNFEASGLHPGEEVQLVWETMTGSYLLEGLYSFIGTQYVLKEVPLLSGKSDANGSWKGSFQVPEGFGGDHTVYVRQKGANAAQTNYFVSPRFTMSPESGPVGTEITIQAEGIGWSTMESNWQLTYDNKLTGLISAVSTNGKATAKLRAAGAPGVHTLTVWHGYIGMPYLNHQQAPTSYLPVPSFEFEVTDGKPAGTDNYVEPVPEQAAGGGLVMPKLKAKTGVSVSLSRDSGTVSEPVTLNASGLPAGRSDVKLVWNTMSGSRVSGNGFAEKQVSLATGLKTDAGGKLAYTFPIPDDLGGIPHRLDLLVGNEVYGQAYLTINPSIVGVTPSSGPAGTKVSVHLKGVGWTEFDNTMYITVDNAYTGYVCGFNTQGDVQFDLVLTGEPGYHIIDLYPGIYKGQQKTPDVYLAPQLTYGQDHPGSKIPAIRLGFEITK
ncbi:hypothetical protein [Cohnella caldifontis]|uniref:hypothetical protein n=1 Tax=Cohnella caldifontis TaxID=3027471 RepID=UPI0023EB1B7F|nr:hypothetical protein [Cohnella sp. YIM B05605]